MGMGMVGALNLAESMFNLWLYFDTTTVSCTDRVCTA